MPKHTATEFSAGKAAVVGLAIHNAKKSENRARVAHDEAEVGKDSSFYIFPAELQPFSLWIVAADCSVSIVVGQSTTADFAKFTTASNLRALADKYKDSIGFVSKRSPWGKRTVWETLPIPANKRLAKA